MKKRLTSITKCSALVILCLISLDNYAQKVASMEVNLTKAAYGLNIPVSINLDELTYLSDSLLVLYEVKDKIKTEIPFQIEAGRSRKTDMDGSNRNRQCRRKTSV